MCTVVVTAWCLGCSATAPATPAVSCDAATQVDGAPAGLERCGERTWNRVSSESCAEATAPTACTGGDDNDTCVSDQDCGSGAHRCVATHVDSCACTTFCLADADCSANEACVCSAVSDGAVLTANVCAPAACRTNDDCSGAPCGLVIDECGTIAGLRCHVAGDCRDDGDCAPDNACVFGASGWACARRATCG